MHLPPASGEAPAVPIILAEAIVLWAALLAIRARVAHEMGILRWWAVKKSLGAGVFAAMMLTSAWKVPSGKGKE